MTFVTSELSLRPSLTHCTDRGLAPLPPAVAVERLALHISWIRPPRTTVSLPVTCTDTSGQPTARHTTQHNTRAINRQCLLLPRPETAPDSSACQQRSPETAGDITRLIPLGLL